MCWVLKGNIRGNFSINIDPVLPRKEVLKEGDNSCPAQEPLNLQTHPPLLQNSPPGFCTFESKFFRRVMPAPHTLLLLPNLLFFFPFFWREGLFRAAPTAYGDSQARSRIGATAAILRHSYSNEGFQPCLWPAPQLMATPDPQLTEAGQGSNLCSHGY